MSQYNFHLDTIILKSTFKVFEENSPYYNAFLSSDGELIPCESHHHVETALEILHKENKSVKSLIGSYARDIKKHKKAKDTFEKIKGMIDPTLGEVPLTKRMLPEGEWIGFYTNLTISTKTCDEKIAERVREIERLKSKIKERYNDLPLNNFKQANKNKGYDTAEFIILNLGFIAIENGYLLYNSQEPHYTRTLNKIGCYLEQDEEGKFIIIKKSQERLEEEYNAEVNYLKSQRSYYQESRNRFHCPSGFVRGDYIRWRNRCLQLGLNYLIQGI